MAKIQASCVCVAEEDAVVVEVRLSESKPTMTATRIHVERSKAEKIERTCTVDPVQVSEQKKKEQEV